MIDAPVSKALFFMGRRGIDTYVYIVFFCTLERARKRKRMRKRYKYLRGEVREVSLVNRRPFLVLPQTALFKRRRGRDLLDQRLEMKDARQGSIASVISRGELSDRSTP